MSTNTSLRSILEKDNLLVGSNYLEWYRKLKIVLKSERKLYVLTDTEPKTPHNRSSESDIIAYNQFQEDAIDVQCLMISSMSPELQKANEHLSMR